MKTPRTFRDLGPEAQCLVRAFAVLDGATLSLVSAAAVLKMPQPHAAEITAGLAAVGWGTATEDRLDITAAARARLPELVPDILPAEVDQVLAHVAAAVKAHMCRMSPAIRTDVVTLIRAAGRHRRFTIASTITRAAWRSPTTHEDLDWTRQLAQCGEDAAIAARHPELFIELLNNSAETYSSAADWAGAERAWLRALAIVEDLHDTPRTVHFFHLLTTNYLNWQRPHKALDMQLETVDIHQRAGDPVKTAEALAVAARIMVDAGRTDAAIDYLTRAERILRTHPDHAVASLHAAILSDLGHVHARLGKINSVRNYYYRALALVVDADEETANRIRALQAASPCGTPSAPAPTTRRATTTPSGHCLRGSEEVCLNPCVATVRLRPLPPRRAVRLARRRGQPGDCGGDEGFLAGRGGDGRRAASGSSGLRTPHTTTEGECIPCPSRGHRTRI